MKKKIKLTNSYAKLDRGLNRTIPKDSLIRIWDVMGREIKRHNKNQQKQEGN